MFPNRLPLFAVAALGSIAASQPALAAPAATDLCQKIVASYKKLVEANPNAASRKSFYSDSPLTVLNDTADSGVSTAPYVAEAGKEHRPFDWARHQGLVLPAELQDKLSKSDFLDRLPDTGFYAASSVQGTLSCYDSVYFEVRNGRAQFAKGPPNWRDEGCGTYRDFGKVGATPVAFEEDYNYSPALTSTLTVSGWTGTGFGPTCTIRFRFRPRFSTKHAYNEWDQSCSADNCDELRQAALGLVEMIQANPVATEKTLLSRLTAAQRAEFEAMEKDAQVTRPEKLQDPRDLVDTSPLALPLVVGTQLYLAKVGHFTIGWRVYSDWSVKLVQREGKEIKDTTAIAIGMAKGKLSKAEVKQAEVK